MWNGAFERPVMCASICRKVAACSFKQEAYATCAARVCDRLRATRSSRSCHSVSAVDGASVPALRLSLSTIRLTGPIRE